MRVAVLGVGLIGGSIGLVARRRVGAHVIGYDPDATALTTALALGAIDQSASVLAEAVAEADVVFVAAPVGALAGAVQEALAFAGRQCIVSDVGSTKYKIVQAVSDERFVGGHPLAGAETAGVEHARADLFDRATWYLTPRSEISEGPTGALHELIKSFGARPASIDAGVHDRLMARVSHLPHVLANLLVSETAAAARLAHSQGALKDSKLRIGPSFRDATRVAGANTAIWTDIYLSNSEALSEAISEMCGQLEQLVKSLKAGDSHALNAWNDRALTERETLQRTDLVPDE